MQTQPLYLNLDEAMSKIMGEDRLAVGRVASRLSDLATSDHPIEIIYALKLTGEPTPVVWEALVQVEDPVLQHMRDLVQVCVASPPSCVSPPPPPCSSLSSYLGPDSLGARRRGACARGCES